jgi:hypothetical protein
MARWICFPIRQRVVTQRAGTLLAVLAIVLAAWLVNHGAFSREPRFMGEPFTDLLGDEVPSAVMGPVGTNGIPTLLRMLQAEDHVVAFIDWWDNLEWLPEWLELPRAPAAEQHGLALLGFRGLGSNAAPAVPKLIHIYEHRPELRLLCVQALGEIGPAAKEAVPLLLRAVTNTDSDLGCAAMFALAGIHSQPESVVPVLVNAAKNAPNLDFENSALFALRTYGPLAKDIAPVLENRIRAYDALIAKLQTTNAHVRGMLLPGYQTERNRFVAILKDVDPR